MEPHASAAGIHATQLYPPAILFWTSCKSDRFLCCSRTYLGLRFSGLWTAKQTLTNRQWTFPFPFPFWGTSVVPHSMASCGGSLNSARRAGANIFSSDGHSLCLRRSPQGWLLPTLHLLFEASKEESSSPTVSHPHNLLLHQCHPWLYPRTQWPLLPHWHWRSSETQEQKNNQLQDLPMNCPPWQKIGLEVIKIRWNSPRSWLATTLRQCWGERVWLWWGQILTFCFFAPSFEGLTFQSQLHCLTKSSNFWIQGTWTPSLPALTYAG